MQNENEYFSVYGSGHGQARYDGIKLFTSSILKSVTRSVAAVVGVLFVGGLAVAAQSFMPAAHAGAWFVVRHMSH